MQSNHAAQRALHVYAITDDLAELKPVRSILKERATEWNMPETYVRQCIQEAYQTLASLATLSRANRREQLVDAWQTLYRNAVETGDLKCAAVCLDRLTKIEGYYFTADDAVSSNTQLGAGNPDAVRARTKELLASQVLQAKLGVKSAN